MSDFNSIEKIINESSNYIAKGIDKYIVDGVTFSGYSEYMFTWKKTYAKPLERASNGNLGNLNTYATFKTPILRVTYPLMTINDFRAMMDQHLNKNEYSVTCYDNIYNKLTTNIMYYADPADPQYWYNTKEDGEVEVLGVKNYTVELIGVNHSDTDNPNTSTINAISDITDITEPNQ